MPEWTLLWLHQPHVDIVGVSRSSRDVPILLRIDLI